MSVCTDNKVSVKVNQKYDQQRYKVWIDVGGFWGLSIISYGGDKGLFEVGILALGSLTCGRSFEEPEDYIPDELFQVLGDREPIQWAGEGIIYKCTFKEVGKIIDFFQSYPLSDDFKENK